MNKCKIGNLDLVFSDEEIKEGDFFIDIKDGKFESHIHQYHNTMKNYVLNGVDVITVNKIEFENDNNHKRIINL